MENALLRMRELRDFATPTERSVIDYLLREPEKAMELSVHELADATFSSSSTIVRLCRKLGFEGYRDFRRAVIYEAARLRHNKTEELREITRMDSMQQIVDKVTHMNVVSLQDTRNLLDIPTLERCAELLCTSETISLFGIGSSLCVARDVYLKFLRLNKPCILNDDWHSQLLQARNMSPRDLGMVISYSGRTVELVECMKAMRENGAPIIAITRLADSPIASLSDYNLYVAANESTFRTGAMSSRISQLNVIDILYTAFANRTYEQSLVQLSRTHIQKP